MRSHSFVPCGAVCRAAEHLPAAVAFGIECALETAEHDSRVQTVDLVWTGPETSAVSVRRSSAVLFELIDGAKSDLIVMSFASFRIPEAEAALHRAVERGVRLDLILETEEESSGRYHQFRRARVRRDRERRACVVL